MSDLSQERCAPAAASGQRHTVGAWLLKDRDDLDLCLRDPGFGVDLTVVADLRTMTRV